MNLLMIILLATVYLAVLFYWNTLQRKLKALYLDLEQMGDFEYFSQGGPWNIEFAWFIIVFLSSFVLPLWSAIPCTAFAGLGIYCTLKNTKYAKRSLEVSLESNNNNNNNRACSYSVNELIGEGIGTIILYDPVTEVYVIRWGKSLDGSLVPRMAKIIVHSYVQKDRVYLVGSSGNKGNL